MSDVNSISCYISEWFDTAVGFDDLSELKIFTDFLAKYLADEQYRATEEEQELLKRILNVIEEHKEFVS